MLIPIARALQETSDREFWTFSRSEETLDLEGDLSELDDVSGIDGLVYFPGTINLKTFHDVEGRRFSQRF